MRVCDHKGTVGFTSGSSPSSLFSRTKLSPHSAFFSSSSSLESNPPVAFSSRRRRLRAVDAIIESLDRTSAKYPTIGRHRFAPPFTPAVRRPTNPTLPSPLFGLITKYTDQGQAGKTAHPALLSMATTILPGMVVPEVLRGEENYENWSDCIKNYLLAQDLWDIIETSMEPPKPEDDDLEVDFKAWRKKNAATLHAIQISCGMNILSEIKCNISSAKVLWDTLAKKYEHPAQEGGDNLRLPAAGGTTGFSEEYEEYEQLYAAVRIGNWNVASNFITRHPDSVRAKITHSGQTALHVAVLARKVDIVRTLVEEKMSREDLEIRDNEGLTALDLTIICGYEWGILECMIRKNGELVTVGNNRGLDIPILLALRHEQRELANHLYEATPFQELLPERGPHGATVVTKAIHTGNYGLAKKLILKCPLLTFTLDTDNVSPLSVFFGTTSLFGSDQFLDLPDHQSNWSTQLRQMIYSCLGISSPSHANPFQYFLDNRKELERRNNGPGSQRSTDHKIGIISIKTEYVGLLNAMFDSIGDMVSYSIGVETGAARAIFSAVRAGKADFIEIIVWQNTELLYWVRDGKRRNVLMSAVQHRQAKIFGMIYGLKETKARLLSSRDNLGNNILHVAGTLTEFSQLDHITGAALKMQTEVQWFQGVENSCNPIYKNEKNYAGLTPKQVFMQTHRKLMKEGEQWMKGTASSCTVVGALIMTIMFAAAFTVPGGNNQNTGFPIFLNKKLFKIFIIANSLSLFSSSTSVLMFLGILTSRYEAKDFLRSLPTKMIVGLSTLFFSIATMMIAFSSAILIMFSGQSWILIPLIGLASIPVCLYVFMQLPLLYDMIVSTYGSNTFDQKMKIGARLVRLFSL